MSILSIDPGDTSGLCEWSNDGKLISQVAMSHEKLLVNLALYAKSPSMIHTVVVEDYTQRVGPQNAKGRKMKAPRGIGAAEMFAQVVGAGLVMQSPGILKIAAMHAGVPIVSHFKDSVSAMLHGWYYFETVGVQPSR